MGYMNEFPHGNNWDSDLREILEMFNGVKCLPIDWAKMKIYIENYFKNLNVQMEIDAKLNEMVADGTMASIVNHQIFNRLEKKIVPLFIGDSYASGDVGGADAAWMALVKRHFPKSYSIAQGGLGFSGKGLGTDLQWITKLKSFVASNDITEITDVFIIGGYNDHYTTCAQNQIYIQEFFNYAKSVFDSSVRFHVGFCGWCGLKHEIIQPTATQESNIIREELIDRVESAYSLMAINCGYAYMGNLTSALHHYNTAFAADGYHPSPEGQNRLACLIYSYIVGGEYTPAPLLNVIECNLSNAISTNERSHIAQTRLGKNGVQICAYPWGGSAPITLNVELTVGVPAVLGELISTSILGARTLRIPAYVKIPGTSKVYNSILGFTSNKLELTVLEENIPSGATISIWIPSMNIDYSYC